MTSASVAVAETARVLAPPPKLRLSEWADQNRWQPPGSPVPGRWKTLGYQRGVFDAFTDPAVKRIVLKTATQLLKTEFILSAVGYVISQDPAPILVVVPRDGDIHALSKDRLAPMLSGTPCLQGLVAEVKSRDANNTIAHKRFPGGHISMSPSNLAARPIKYLFCDEVDKYPLSAGTEGDPISLAEKRLAWYWDSKEIATCSPTIEGLSKIAKLYDESDQREYLVPCPHCGEFQKLIWSQVKWDNILPRKQLLVSVRYECSKCSAHWNDVERWRACEKGRWVAQEPFGGVAGFHLNEIASPRKKLRDLVEDYLGKKDDVFQLQTFVNTTLAETWKQKGEAPDWERLKSRTEDYDLGMVPTGVLFLTAGADVQKDRIEVAVWGWGRGAQSWLVDYLVLDGNTSRPEVWEKLDEALERSYEHEGGLGLPIARMAVDAGYETTMAYQFTRHRGGARVLAVFGRSSGVALLWQGEPVDVTIGGKRRRRGLRPWLINVSMAKVELYGRLDMEPPEDSEYPPGWVHYPPMADEWFKQLTAEQWVARVVKGYRKGQWEKTRERNEVLDCRIYARAAAEHVGMSRFTDAHWTALEEQMKPVTPSVQATRQQPAPVRRKTRSRWMDS